MRPRLSGIWHRDKLLFQIFQLVSSAPIASRRMEFRKEKQEVTDEPLLVRPGAVLLINKNIEYF